MNGGTTTVSDLFIPFKENELPTVKYLYNMESIFKTQL